MQFPLPNSKPVGRRCTRFIQKRLGRMLFSAGTHWDGVKRNHGRTNYHAPLGRLLHLMMTPLQTMDLKRVSPSKKKTPFDWARWTWIAIMRTLWPVQCAKRRPLPAHRGRMPTLCLQRWRTRRTV